MGWQNSHQLDALVRCPGKAGHVTSVSRGGHWMCECWPWDFPVWGKTRGLVSARQVHFLDQPTPVQASPLLADGQYHHALFQRHWGWGLYTPGTSGTDWRLCYPHHHPEENCLMAFTGQQGNLPTGVYSTEHSIVEASFSSYSVLDLPKCSQNQSSDIIQLLSPQNLIPTSWG